ncbi:MAG TPA: 3-keto-5-aminohexanoate cleavage protein, partial [Candidatus Udaeobacter sp.]|nr:3-keto-5-aminohexanoate cleavage protein [Candidatus Udaeobacter sp.]
AAGVRPELEVFEGGHIRLALSMMERGKLAPSNAALVEKAVDIIQALGGEIATAGEARSQLNLSVG